MASVKMALLFIATTCRNTVLNAVRGNVVCENYIFGRGCAIQSPTVLIFFSSGLGLNQEVKPELLDFFELTAGLAGFLLPDDDQLSRSGLSVSTSTVPVATFFVPLVMLFQVDELAVFVTSGLPLSIGVLEVRLWGVEVLVVVVNGHTASASLAAKKQQAQIRHVHRDVDMTVSSPRHGSD